MKNIIFGLAIASTTLAACNSNNDKTDDAKQNDVQNDTSTAAHQINTDTALMQTTAVFPAKEIIAGYLQIKNALAKDNGKDAATAGNAIVTTLATINNASLSADQQKVFSDLQGDIKEHAEHIAANGGKIEHQREHFIMLSKDMADLIKTFGTGGQTLYKDFCPMANDGKGATWISEVKEIKNPYFGNQMSGCGSIKETIK